MDKPVIYTIGHSTHQLEYFLHLLEEYSINCLVDVRSVAASTYNPQYNKEPLSNFLKARSREERNPSNDTVAQLRKFSASVLLHPFEPGKQS